jgi:hypothetical protein
LFAVILLSLNGGLRAANSQSALTGDDYSTRIQPIFTSRCIACHSCYNAPCQLNLQSYSGLARGATKLKVYDRSRLESIAPSRPDIDGHSVSDWRARGFFEVVGKTTPARTLLLQFLELRAGHPAVQPQKSVQESSFCPANGDQFSLSAQSTPELGMPYGLPPLSQAEIATMQDWISNGALGPTEVNLANQHAVPPERAAEVRTWETFLNGSSPREKLFARYLFEHLFLAHLHFLSDATSPQPVFFRLVRSRTPCETGIDEIATRRPNDDPGSLDFHYCLSRLDAVIVDIKGPVCNGSIAVNSIQAQFFVLFLRPDSDSMVTSPEFARQAQDLLILPGVWGSDVPLVEDVGFYGRLIEHREAFRKLRAENVGRLRPAGYTLDDIWDGDGANPNALLTIFRHLDTAVVTRGAVGDLSKTLFVLDYSLLERLVYNLVVNYDVFGNVGHQSLTRLYMDLIRMEAEELFLSFLPPSQRASLRNSWYQGGPFTEVKIHYVFPLIDSSAPTGVVYRNPANAKAEFVEQVLNEHLPLQVRGPPDALNWKTLQLSRNLGTGFRLAAPEQALRSIASIKAADATPFARFFPDLAVILMRGKDERATIYSLVHNRELSNVSWILEEADRFVPREDSLTVRAGVLGAYPNMFFVVPEDKISVFSAAILNIKSAGDYEQLVNKFGVRRSNEQFWSIFDAINSIHISSNPVRAGTLDLTRYSLDAN